MSRRKCSRPARRSLDRCLSSWSLLNLLSRPRGPRAARLPQPLAQRLFVELLEDRTLLSSGTGTLPSITGTVQNANHQPVAGATVYLDTNHNGQLDQQATFEGDTQITPSFYGYYDAPVNVFGVSESAFPTSVQLNFSEDSTGSSYLVFLVSPLGQEEFNGPILLTTQPNESFNGTFNDAAPTSINTATFPAYPSALTGSFQPSQALNTPGLYANGSDPNNPWILLFTNTSGQATPVTGFTLNSWSMTFPTPEPSTTTDAGGNYSFSNLPDGTYNVAVANVAGANPSQTVTVTDGQSSPANFSLNPVAADLAGASLQVVNVVPPATTGGAASVTLAYSVVNEGPGDAGAFNIDFDLSSTQTITDNPQSLLTTVQVPGIAAGGSYSGTVTVDVPTTSPLDQEYVGYVLNPDDAVPETNLANNSNQGLGIDVAAVQAFGNQAVTDDDSIQQEPSLAVDPNNANHLVLAYQQYATPTSPYPEVVVASSFNGGSTWSTSAVPLPAALANGDGEAGAGYAQVAFDNDGHAYVVFMAAEFLGNDPPLLYPDGGRDSNGNLYLSYGLTSNNGIYLVTSTEEGDTDVWSAPITVTENLYDGETEVPWDTRPAIAVDNSATSPYEGNIYVAWTRIWPAGQYPNPGEDVDPTGGTDIMLAVSNVSNLGTSWTVKYQEDGVTPVVRDPGNSGVVSEGGGFANFAQVTVAPSGNVLVSENQGGNYEIFTSSDGGNSFGSPLLPFGSLQSNPFDQVPNLQLYPGAPSLTYPVDGIYVNPTLPDDVYALDAMQDYDPLTGTTNDPGDIYLSSSSDNGQDWNTFFTVGNNLGNVSTLPPEYQFYYRSVLNDDDGSNFLGFASDLSNNEISMQAVPEMTVDAHGNMTVVWYDSRRSPSGEVFDVYGTTSTNGGVTWSANYLITTQSFDAAAASVPNANPTAEPAYTTFPFLSDSIGLASANGEVYVAWTDTLGGNDHIYFSRFSVAPPPPSPGDYFEPDNTPATATNLGEVTTQQTYPQLTLSGGAQEWYQLTPGSGSLLVSVAAGAGEAGPQLDLYQQTAQGLVLVATGTAVAGESGETSLAAAVQPGGTYFVEVFGVPLGGATVPYTLSLQSLTQVFGTQVYDTVQGAVSAGGQDLYAVTAAVTGELVVQLTDLTDTQNGLSLEVLSSDGQTVLATGSSADSTSLTTSATVAVTQGETVLLQVSPLEESDPSYSLTFTNLDQDESESSSLFFATGQTPTAVAFADLNNDGNPDLVTASPSLLDPVNVLLGQANGLFSAPQGYDAGPGTSSGYRSLLVGQFEGTDKPEDVVVSNYQSANISLLAGSAGGTLAPQQLSDAVINPNAMVSGDFNGDGIEDLAVLEQTAPSGPSQLAILLGRGDGSFLPPTLLPTIFTNGASAIVAGDFTDNGITDLAVFGNNSPDIEIFLGDGHGNFTAGQVIITGDNTASAVAADLTGDGNVDLITGGTTSGDVFVLMGNGNGTFQAPVPYLANTDSLKAGASISGLAVAALNGFGGSGSTLDIIATAIPRIGGGAPQINVLLGNGDGTFQAAQQVAVGGFTGPIAVATLNGASAIAAAVSGGVQVLYANPPDAINTTSDTARDLGTVVHLVTPTAVISPSFQDAYYTMTVPTEIGPDGESFGGPEVIDFSLLAQYVAGQGLSMTVQDLTTGQPLALAAPGEISTLAGTRFRGVANQGDELLIHIYGQDDQSAAAYTLDITVLPQVVSAQALSALPNGPATEIVLTLQGAPLDPTAAQTASNYKVIGPNGQVVPLSSTPGTQAVVYDADTDLQVGVGLTVPATVQQTITLLFSQALPPGTYQIQISPNVVTAPFSAEEASLLYSPLDDNEQPIFNGHPVVALSVTQNPTTINVQEGPTLTFQDLVSPPGPTGNLSVFAQGTPFLTQLHELLGTTLTYNITQLGDILTVGKQTTADMASWLAAGFGDTQITAFWLDPVSIDLEDAAGDRVVYNQQTNTVSNSLPQTYVEVGGNIEVVVFAGNPAGLTLDLSEISATARGGAVLIGPGGVQTVSLTSLLQSDSGKPISVDLGALAGASAASADNAVVAAPPNEGTSEVAGGGTVEESTEDVLVSAAGSYDPPIGTIPPGGLSSLPTSVVPLRSATGDLSTLLAAALVGVTDAGTNVVGDDVNTPLGDSALAALAARTAITQQLSQILPGAPNSQPLIDAVASGDAARTRLAVRAELEQSGWNTLGLLTPYLDQVTEELAGSLLRGSEIARQGLRQRLQQAQQGQPIQPAAGAAAAVPAGAQDAGNGAAAPAAPPQGGGGAAPAVPAAPQDDGEEDEQVQANLPLPDAPSEENHALLTATLFAWSLAQAWWETPAAPAEKDSPWDEDGQNYLSW